jgi:uncharacterized protein involved in exopolysaccharide biosynthesis
VEDKEITLVDLIIKIKETGAFLWKKKITLLVSGLLGGVIGLIYAYNKPIEYKSNVTFIVESSSKSGGLGALGGLASSFGLGGVGGDGGLFDNQVNLMKYLKSQTILESVLLSELDQTGKTFAQKFVEAYEWDNNWKDSKALSRIEFKLGEARDNFSLTKDSILHSISQQLNEMIEVIKPEKEGSIISIEVSTQDDSISKFLPERLLSLVAEKYIEMKTRLSQQTVDVLQRQTDSVQNVLYGSLSAAATSTDQVFGLNPAMAVKRVPAAKEQIDVQASTILLGELIKNLELAKMKLKDQTPLIEIIDSSRFPLEKKKTSKMKSIILFGFGFGLITIFYLLIRRFFQRIMREG